MRRVSLAQTGPPTSVDRYLLPHERSVIAVRMHPAALAEPLILACGGLVAAWKLASRSARPDIIWGAYLLLPLDLLRRLAAWPVTGLAVTDKRMVVIGGLASRTVAAIPVEKVTGLTLQRTALGRLLDYGTLIVDSPGRRQAFRKIRYVPYPEQLYLEIAVLLWPEGPDGTVSPAGDGEAMTAYDSAEPFQQELHTWPARVRTPGLRGLPGTRCGRPSPLPAVRAAARPARLRRPPRPPADLA